MTIDYQGLPHAGIQTLSPYIPGKSITELTQELGLHDIIKLASNENPHGCSKNALNILKKIDKHDLATYPISSIHPLREKLARHCGVSKECIALANGSDMLFPLIMTCFALHKDKHILTHDFAFIVYSICAKTLGLNVIHAPITSNWHIDVDALIAKSTEKTALIFLANPNNPTGTMLPHLEIKRLLDHVLPTTIVVLDEAYYEYACLKTDDTSIALIQAFPNLIITRTFSKAYGLAGLRLGYTIACPDITSILLRANQPFTVNTCALNAAFAALDDQEFIAKTITANQDGLKKLQLGLDKLQLEWIPSSTNFITINCKQDANNVYQKLLQKGIIVRPLHPYGMNNFLRVTIGTEAQNARFLDTLKNCL